MKTSKIIGALMLIALVSIQAMAQKVLPEIVVYATNYKYLSAAGTKEVAQPVSMLERYAAAFDPRESQFYEEEYDNYFISFYIPEGKMLAAYDKDGTLVRTVEKYKDVAVPQAVRTAVAKRFPKWTISKDVYLVTFHDKKGITKRYKLILENGDQRMRVKIDDKGEFL